MIPWGDHTQLSSFVIGTFLYLPSTISNCHSTLEKSIRHFSPWSGGETFLDGVEKDAQGMAISTLQEAS